MAQLMFQKAEKKKAKLRLAIFGPSGAGKTFTALRIAKGMGSRTAVIDTENSSASKYADRFDFDTVNLIDKSIDGVCEAFKAAAAAGYEVVIIDSMSHAWQELLDQVDALASSKFRGNSHAAWSEGTPKQRQFIRAILETPFHLIATMRSKTLWAEEEDKGKKKMVKIGLAPEQGKGIEYEFDMLMELDVDHRAFISKDRTGKYQDKSIVKPGEDLGKDLIDWLNSGVATITATQSEEIITLARKKGSTAKKLIENAGITRMGEMTVTTFDRLKAELSKLPDSTDDKAIDKRNASVTEQLIRAGVSMDQINAYCESLPFAGNLPDVVAHLELIVRESSPEQIMEKFGASAAA